MATYVSGSVVLPFVVTWNVREYWGGRVWVGPGVPMPAGSVVATVVGVSVGTVVGVAVAGGVSGAWVHPAKNRSSVTRDRARIKEIFFIPCSGTTSRYNHCYNYLTGFSGHRTLEQDQDTALAQSTIDHWLDGTTYSVTRLTLHYHPYDFLISGPAHAEITVAGSGELPDIDQLAQSIEGSLGYPVTIELRVRPEQINYYPKILKGQAIGS